METLKVSTRSNHNAVAGAMAGAVRTAGAVEVQVVGAGALNQAIKALAIARGYVAAAGIDLVCVPNFADIEIDGERRTAMRLVIGDRHGARIAPMATPIAPLHVAPQPVEPEPVAPQAATPQAATPPAVSSEPVAPEAGARRAAHLADPLGTAAGRTEVGDEES